MLGLGTLGDKGREVARVVDLLFVFFLLFVVVRGIGSDGGDIFVKRLGITLF